MGPLPAAGTAPAQTHRASPHRRAHLTARRTLAALAALLVAASTLTVITAAPAGAHTQTKRYCAYDPFAGNQCWTENVAHKHAPSPSCPAGTTGTPPNCSPVPSTNENHDPNADKDDDSGGDDSGGGDSGGDDSGGSDDDSTNTDSGDSGDSGDDDTGSDDNSGDDSGGDDDGGNQKGTRQNRGTTTPTTTTSTDPCGDWADALIAAINKNNDGTGTYTPPPERPEACGGMTNAEIAAMVKRALNIGGLAVADALKKLLEATSPESISKAQLALVREIQELWDKTPDDAKRLIRITVSSAGCVGLAAAIVKSSTASGGAAVPAWVAVLATAKGQAAVGIFCPVVVEAATILVDKLGSDSSDDSGSGGSSQQPAPDPDDPDGDYDGNGKTERDELGMADQKLWDGEITAEEYQRIWRKYACDSGDTHECDK